MGHWLSKQVKSTISMHACGMGNVLGLRLLYSSRAPLQHSLQLAVDAQQFRPGNLDTISSLYHASPFTTLIRTCTYSRSPKCSCTNIHSHHLLFCTSPGNGQHGGTGTSRPLLTVNGTPATTPNYELQRTLGQSPSNTPASTPTEAGAPVGLARSKCSRR